jgi:hypothetical protein
MASWNPFGVNKLIRVGFLKEHCWSFCRCVAQASKSVKLL